LSLVRRLLPLLAATLVLGVAVGPAQAAGVTNSGDDLRTGWHPDQPSLNPQLVSGGTFGQLWKAPVAGQVYAQPLLADGTLLVATEENQVYGLDPASGGRRWHRDLGVPMAAADLGCGDLTPTIGVTGTPVVDERTGTAYLAAKRYVSGTSGPTTWELHALDVDTGAEREGFPVEIGGTAHNAPGQTFRPTTQLQRPGLLLLDGVVYVGFGGHCDIAPWQGWVFGVSTEGRTTARWVAVAEGDGAGIWQSGVGLMSDGPGRIFVTTGNGGSPAPPIPGSTPPDGLGEAAVRLEVQPDGTLRAADFFAPFDARSLDGWDADFASGGLVGLPAPHFGTAAFPRLAVTASKQGYVYLLDRDRLGGIGMGPNGSDGVVQRLGPYGGVWARPGVWPGDGGYVYIPTASGGASAAGSSGHLRVYRYGRDAAGAPTLSLQASSSDAWGFSSSSPVITSDGTTSGSALVWAVWAPGGNGLGAQLRAYDPVPVDGKPVLRWSAPIGQSAKFAMPGIGAGKVFVGTRDGHVLGFGSPVTPPLTGPATAFGAVTVGESATRTVRLTATDTLTIAELTASAGFAVAERPEAPAQLRAGDTVEVTVTFTPTRTGLAGGALTATTDRGIVAFSLSGSGRSAGPDLAVSPPAVTFGGTRIGGHLTGTVTFSNVGAESLTVQETDRPAAPFTATGLPEPGDVIAPGDSLTASVAFDPTAGGEFVDELGLTTTGGTESAGLSGSAADPGELVVTESDVAHGTVPVGWSTTRTFTVANVGDSAVTILKSKPPSGGAFSAFTELAEGTTIPPRTTLTRTVRFRPTAPGHTEGDWVITGDDASGTHEVHTTGTGHVPALEPGWWTANGGALLANGLVRLTAAEPGRTGSSFFQTALTPALRVQFEQRAGGGQPGSGMTLALTDPARGATPRSVGTGGAQLGFGGLPGVAVALGTDASGASYVRVIDGAVDGTLRTLAETRAVPDLRSGTRAVRVDVARDQLVVAIDGVQRLSVPVTLPDRVLLGFTAATGGDGGDEHAVGALRVTGAPAPAPATLAITNAVRATGPAQSTTTTAFRGRCPSTFRTAAVADGGRATPPLVGAVAGRTCSVAFDAPAGADWTTRVSVNGAPAQIAEPVAGVVNVPAFTLRAGANTIAVTSTHDPALPAPTDDRWQLNGTARHDGGAVELTPTDVAYVAGSAFWSEAVDPRAMTAEFEARIGGGSGADGLALVIADPIAGARPTSLGYRGGGLGVGGIPGHAVTLLTYPSSRVAVTDGVQPGRAADQLRFLAPPVAVPDLRAAPRRVRVDVRSGTLTVAIDGQRVLTQAVPNLPPVALVGFSAGTGQLRDRHAVSAVRVTGTAPTPAASLRITSSVQAAAGTPDAAAEIEVRGTCPTGVAVTGLGDADGATPDVGAARAGQQCTIGQVPLGPGWTTTASVNGGPPVTLTERDGRLVVPAFALRPGENVVALRNVAAVRVLDPAAGGWKLNGTAAVTGSELELTAAGQTYAAGSAFWPDRVDPRAMTVEFDETIGGGTGADGLALVIADPARGATQASLGYRGGGLGFGGIAGTAVALTTYPASRLGVTNGPMPGGRLDQLGWVGERVAVDGLAGSTHRVRVTVANGTLTVFVDDQQRLARAVALPPSAQIGFSAGTGQLTNRHAVRDVRVTASAPPPPPDPTVPPVVPGPTGGGWTVNGPARVLGDALQLTAAEQTYAAATAFWPTAVDPVGLRIAFDADIGGGPAIGNPGADGLGFVIADPARGASPTSVGFRGGGIGFGGIPGVAVALTTYPSGQAGVATGTLPGLAFDKLAFTGATVPVGLQDRSRRVVVTIAAGAVAVSVDGTEVLRRAVALPARAFLGFSAGTGLYTNRHAVRNVVITRPAVA
jgi:iron transport multicopper oxidase